MTPAAVKREVLRLLADDAKVRRAIVRTIWEDFWLPGDRRPLRMMRPYEELTFPHLAPDDSLSDAAVSAQWAPYRRAVARIARRVGAANPYPPEPPLTPAQRRDRRNRAARRRRLIEKGRRILRARRGRR